MLFSSQKYSLLKVLLVCLTAHFNLFSQENFEKSERLKIAQEMALFEDKTHYKYLNLIPTISYNTLNNSFNVGFSFSSILNYYQQKKRNQIQLAQLESRLNERLENETDNLTLKIEEFEAELNALKNRLLVFDIDFKIYQITTGKYKNNKITTEHFLQLKRAFFTKKHSLENSLSRLKLKAKYIDQKTRNGFSKKPLLSLTNTILNYDKQIQIINTSKK